jgi:hypothetical protein
MLNPSEVKMNKVLLIHNRALYLSKAHRKVEWQIIEVLQQVEALKIYAKFGKSSLFLYAVEVLGFSESVAYSFISVARKAKQIPELQKAIREQKLSVSKANRIVSTLNSENAKSLVGFASSNSLRDIDREVARINPRAAGKDQVKEISEDLVQVTMTLKRSTYEKLKRVSDIHDLSLPDCLERLSEDFLEKHDPVRKAKRLAQPELCSHRVGELNTQEKHRVNARDERRCTHLDEGKRCPNRRWIEIHHIVPRYLGGNNHSTNLTTLCSFHHRQLHRNDHVRKRPDKSQFIG